MPRRKMESVIEDHVTVAVRYSLARGIPAEGVIAEIVSEAFDEFADGDGMNYEVAVRIEKAERKSVRVPVEDTEPAGQ